MKEAWVRALGRRAGVDSDWTDARGQPQRVALEALVRILGALGFPCSTSAEGRDSLDRLLAIGDGFAFKASPCEHRHGHLLTDFVILGQ